MHYMKFSQVQINLDPYHQMGSQEVGYEGPAASFFPVQKVYSFTMLHLET